MVASQAKVTLFFMAGAIAGLLLSVIIGDAMKEALRTHVPMTVKYVERQCPSVARSPHTHEEVNSVPGPKPPPILHDPREHHDDDTVAKDLYKNVRVLIWVMTAPENHKKKAFHVKNTWGKRANVLLFMSDSSDKDLPAIGLNVSHGRDHLTMKTMRAFQYVYDHHFNDADWFMKADDDTYVIVENLRYMLSNYSSDTPIFFGHHFVTIVKQGYFSGGGGYVVSKEALRRFAKRKPNDCAKDGGPEDAEFGKCMEKLNVKPGNANDALGRSRFHCFNAETHLIGGYPDWYLQYDKYHGRKGNGNMSDYPITFHYIDPNHMYTMEFFTYHLRPYGIISGLKDTNPLEKSKSKSNSEKVVSPKQKKDASS